MVNSLRPSPKMIWTAKPLKDYELTTFTRTRLNPKQRKQQLLNSAIQVFARRGIGRAAHADIAEDTGVSVPTVFNYFKTREDLVDAVLTHVETYFVNLANEYHLNQDQEPLSALEAHSFSLLKKAEESPELVKIWLEWSSSVRNDTWPRYIAFQDKILDIMEPTIQKGLDQGTMNSQLNARDLARIMFGQAHPVTLASFAPNPPISDMVRFVQLGMYALLGIQKA